jgi:hypothetical protein
MHISLDSALGRQRRLNSVGESITQIAPDPAAAYSLRSLTGGDPKVVRVRRGSDNHEQDFTASDVSSGALVDFVNAQVTAPLDIQALTSTGRDGDFLIAKAAYSLRSLGTRQATLAATGDTVARADGKFVCQVRSITGDIKSFTATEVSDGTLVDFVLGNTKSLLNSRAYFDGSNDEVDLTSDIDLTGDFSIQFSLVVTVKDQRILGKKTGIFISASGNNEIQNFKGNLASSGFTLTLISNLKYGEEHTVKFKRVSGKIGMYNESDTLISNEITTSETFTINSFGKARGQFAKGVIHSIRIDTNGDGTINHSYNGYGNTLSDWTDLVGSNNASAVDGSPALFTGQDQDGFVKTWYDQSVTTQAGDTATGNHATQATAANQPKIVSAGALNTNGGLLFDGTNDKLGFTALDDANVAMFSVLRFNDVSGTKQVLGSSIGDGTFGIDAEDVYKYSDNSGSEDGDLNATITTSADFLYSGLKSGSGNTISFFTNGTASEVKTITGSVESDTIGGPTNHLSANLKEIVIYTTDQSDNRTAIEANIGEVYSIDLPSGVDPGDNAVDGFVETWYDQSGNGNNAVQATAGNQPKIVNAGSYLGLVRTDGVDDFFDLTTQIDFNSSHGVFAVYADAGGNRFSLIGRPTSTGGMGYNNASASSTGVGIMHVNGAQQNSNISGIDKTQQNTLYILWQPDSASAIYGVSGSEVTRTFTSDGGNANFTDDVSIPITVIGKDNDAISQQDFKEIIIYATDQTSKRTTLEANMAAAHGITLS